MENQNRWTLGMDSVICTQLLFKNLKTCTTEELLEQLRHSLGDQPLLNDGAPCRVLEPGKPWRQGNVRIVIEFQPDEPPADPQI